MKTKRNELISQLRYALGQLESPILRDNNIEFEILDTSFELEEWFLNLKAE